MSKTIIQHFYRDEIAVCYGCGKNNPRGLRIQTEWDGTEGTFRFTPEPYHTAFPGVVYGGLIACLIDCHSIGTAVAAAYDRENRSPGTDPEILFVTGNLNVRYLAPAPIGAELQLRSTIQEMHERKTVVACTVSAEGRTCAEGEVVAVRAAFA
ncbi:MAG: PaaI family thioesterase [Desulfobacterales bacterium]|jgi:acyl-coenzyme A thioesterase PaaI-like protein